MTVMCKQVYGSWVSAYVLGIHLEEGFVAEKKAQVQDSLQVHVTLFSLRLVRCLW